MKSTLPLRPDWEEIKDQVMLRGVLRKFETHADIRAVLLATGEELLVEHAPRDYYWGCGADGSRAVSVLVSEYTLRVKG
jgi:ribA/ribD-fused uncharacterized protein